MSRARRSEGPTITVISWRDIPAQVRATSAETSSKTELPPRFQTAIDRAAMLAGLFGTDDYLSEWRRTTRSCGDDLGAEVAAEVERLEATFTSTVLTAHANNGGFNPEPAHEESHD